MQNISYVYAMMGRRWVTGLLPAEHVGMNVASRIEGLIREVEGMTLPSIAQLSKRRETQQEAQATTTNRCEEASENHGRSYSIHPRSRRGGLGTRGG